MYVGFWKENISYKRGDIVYVEDLKEYYICDLEHKSDCYFIPAKEDLYWIYISNSFLSELLKTKSNSTTKSNSIKRPSLNLNRKEDVKTVLSYSDSEEYTDTNKEGRNLKRKLISIEKDLDNHKRKKICKENNVDSLRDKLLLMNLDLDTKTYLIDKYDNTQKLTGSDYSKSMNWLRTVSKIP